MLAPVDISHPHHNSEPGLVRRASRSFGHGGEPRASAVIWHSKRYHATMLCVIDQPMGFRVQPPAEVMHIARSLWDSRLLTQHGSVLSSPRAAYVDELCTSICLENGKAKTPSE